MIRDQQRAIFAYDEVEQVPVDEQDDYRTAVLGLGSTVRRSGLVAALSFLQRRKDSPAFKRLFEHLGKAGIPGLHASGGANVADELCDQARHLDLEGYMLATRELLKVAHWLKRAAEATFKDTGAGGGAGDASRHP